MSEGMSKTDSITQNSHTEKQLCDTTHDRTHVKRGENGRDTKPFPPDAQACGDAGGSAVPLLVTVAAQKYL